MKRWEIIKALEDGFKIKYIPEYNGETEFTLEELPHEEFVLKDVFAYPERFEIAKPKKKITECTFMSSAGDIVHCIKNSTQYNNLNKNVLFEYVPVFDIEKEFDEE